MGCWTELIHCQTDHKDPYNANSLPIYQTATFAQHKDVTLNSEYDYSRSGNPTRDHVDQYIAKLESAKFALTFNSGMSAVHAVTQLIGANEHIIAGQDIYGGTHRLLHKLLSQYNIEISRVDLNDDKALSAAIKANTKLVLLETPSNPLQQITDIKAVSQITKAHHVLLAVDNTMLSPWLQQPLTLGADIVIHSATKHLSGHSDITAGVIATNNNGIYKQLKFIQNATGSALEAMPAWLLLRSIKTLGLRIERQQANAQAIAEFLQNHCAVDQVYYAGLATHNGHNTLKSQAKGAGSVLSFTTKSPEQAEYIVRNTKLFTISVSFGSLASLISLPTQMSHASIDKNQQCIPNNLIRISAGIEDAEDLIQDLRICLNNSKYTKHVETTIL